MAVPKKRDSKSKVGRRRANKSLSAKRIDACKQCKGPTTPHRACKQCGTVK